MPALFGVELRTPKPRAAQKTAGWESVVRCLDTYVVGGDDDLPEGIDDLRNALHRHLVVVSGAAPQMSQRFCSNTTTLRKVELEDAFLAIASLRVLPSTARYALLRLSGMRVETRSIREACYFGSSKITIGRGTRVNRGCFFDAQQPIRIGERCNIGMEAMFITSTHAIGDHNRRADTSASEPIEIGDGCWIGARATILPGVTLGDGVVIAAGAVVTSDCEEDTLYAGVPARAVRKL